MTDERERRRKRLLAVVVIAAGSCLLAGAAALAWTALPAAKKPAAPTPAEPRGSAAQPPRAGVSRTALERVPIDQPDGAPEVIETSGPIRLEQLPDDLKQQAIDAMRACRHARETLGLPNHEWSYPHLTLANARALVEREAQLKQQILDSALMEHSLLQGRLAEDSNLGVKVAVADRARLDELLAQQYPGWPDGYRFVEEDDGEVVRVAAWRVADDPVLAALVRDHDALTGEYAATIRSQYIQYLSP